MSFFESDAKYKKFIPGPGQYIKNLDWSKSMHAVCRQPGAFSPSQRKMLTEEIIKEEKNKPGPTKYKSEVSDRYLYKIRGNYKQTEKQVNFTREAVAIQECNKFYPPVDLDITHKRAQKANFSSPIINEGKFKNFRIGAIKKVYTPNYEHTKAKDKIQAKKYNVSSPKAAKINFY